LVGIGGGVPGEEEDDIRLGDVVVSKPTATFGGVVQYDMSKVTVGGILQRTGMLKPPPTVLMANIQRLQAQQIRSGSQIPEHLAAMLKKYPNMRKKQYVYQGEEHDRLFEATYAHVGGTTCRDCDQTKVVERPSRSDSDPEIHYGTIGSGNTVVKDGATRERLRKDLGVLCVEMEAAGLMDEFSCLVIRGICDYADSHKNKRWQPYAAATAAAYMKELLDVIPAPELQPRDAIVPITVVADGHQNTVNLTARRDKKLRSSVISRDKAAMTKGVVRSRANPIRNFISGLAIHSRHHRQKQRRGL
jgi:nucleoside phosphorylase